MHQLKGKTTGIYFIDSTKLQICHNKRTSSNKVFNKKARMEKSGYGGFMRYKQHLIINNQGEIIATKITEGNESALPCTQYLTQASQHYYLPKFNLLIGFL
jgi:hypothetical protein